MQTGSTGLALPPSKPHTPRRQHYAEPTTASTCGVLLRLGGVMLRHFPLPAPDRLSHSLPNRQALPEELHVRIQRAHVARIVESAAVCRRRQREGSTDTVSHASTAPAEIYRERSAYPGHAQRQVVQDKFLQRPHFGPSSPWLRRSQTPPARQYIH